MTRERPPALTPITARPAVTQPSPPPNDFLVCYAHINCRAAGRRRSATAICRDRRLAGTAARGGPRSEGPSPRVRWPAGFPGVRDRTPFGQLMPAGSRPTPARCGPSVGDAGPASSQRWANIYCWMSCRPSVAISAILSLISNFAHTQFSHVMYIALYLE